MSVTSEYQVVFRNISELVLKEISDRYAIDCEQGYNGKFYFKTESGYILEITPHEKTVRLNKRIYRPKLIDASCDTGILKRFLGVHKQLYKEMVLEYENKLRDIHKEVLNDKFVGDLLELGYSISFGSEIDRLINKEKN